ncbi:hypothetical protein B0J12DRAFT_332170 [Macrophomina phaseolina]|uniref:Uncharacterized protein n=1 Tax=Macrophomina phaseolina TaxID=35725 RepID=A0ABQ8GLY9_9PEZI|nr:hypothetical protein B0J12DRAFT_332170 [Macrophomina phaseolina]
MAQPADVDARSHNTVAADRTSTFQLSSSFPLSAPGSGRQNLEDRAWRLRNKRASGLDVSIVDLEITTSFGSTPLPGLFQPFLRRSLSLGLLYTNVQQPVCLLLLTCASQSAQTHSGAFGGQPKSLCLATREASHFGDDTTDPLHSLGRATATTYNHASHGIPRRPDKGAVSLAHCIRRPVYAPRIPWSCMDIPRSLGIIRRARRCFAASRRACHSKWSHCSGAPQTTDRTSLQHVACSTSQM